MTRSEGRKRGESPVFVHMCSDRVMEAIHKMTVNKHIHVIFSACHVPT